MKKYGVLFHDNDFMLTFHGVLTSVGEALKWCWHGESIGEEHRNVGNARFNDKQYMLNLINSMVWNHYLLYQNDYNYLQDLDKKEFYTKYLQIDEDHFLMDEEVDNWKAANDWNNGESFFLEFDSYNNSFTVYNI
jgi:hypothetical protein